VNRAAARTILRRRLNDDAEDEYEDPELNEMINQGLALVQKEVLKVRPQAFTEWTTRNITANQNRYPLPVGTIKVLYVGTRSASSGEFGKLDRKDFNVLINAYQGVRAYAHQGREILVAPTPSEAVTDGMRLITIPTIELGDDDSTTEDKGLPRPLDMAAVVWAHELITPETGEDRAAVARERKDLLEDLPQWFANNADGNEQITLDLIKYPVGVR
jgi:hypothetical protein